VLVVLLVVADFAELECLISDRQVLDKLHVSGKELLRYWIHCWVGGGSGA
jgi:hypothetical protein